MTSIEELRNMIDVTTAATVYAHLETNEEIEYAMELTKKGDLAEVSTMMINGEINDFTKAIQEGKVKYGIEIKPEIEIDVIYLPPAYVYKIREVA